LPFDLSVEITCTTSKAADEGVGENWIPRVSGKSFLIVLSHIVSYRHRPIRNTEADRYKYICVIPYYIHISSRWGALVW
jgi:hypothetical protein